MSGDMMSPAAIMALDNCLVRAVLLYPFTKHRMIYPLIALFCLISAFSKSFTLFTSLFSVALHQELVNLAVNAPHSVLHPIHGAEKVFPEYKRGGKITLYIIKLLLDVCYVPVCILFQLVNSLIYFVIILFYLLFYLFCAALEVIEPPLDEEGYHSKTKGDDPCHHIRERDNIIHRLLLSDELFCKLCDPFPSIH